MSGEPVAVVGRGMIGAAAARHLAEAGVPTVLVGPGEPDVWGASGPVASHWDEGRVTRVSSTVPTWAEVAARSIGRYADIEARSGIRFHDPRGFVWLTHDAAFAAEQATIRGGHARVETTEWLRTATGIAAVDPTCGVCVEAAPAGVINPRRFVAAEAALAARAGAELVEHAVDSVTPQPAGVRLHGAFGTIDAAHVVLATGPHGAALAGVPLVLERRLRTILRADVGPGHGIPSAIFETTGQPELFDAYWVPPVPYENGRTMLKIGGDLHDVPIAESDDELRAWFRSGGSRAEAGVLEATLRRLLPDATIDYSDHLPCVTTYTPDGLPYIGPIDERITVALGGSGAAAKSADELGRLAALATGHLGDEPWVDDAIDLQGFAPRFVGDPT